MVFRCLSVLVWGRRMLHHAPGFTEIRRAPQSASLHCRVTPGRLRPLYITAKHTHTNTLSKAIVAVYSEAGVWPVVSVFIGADAAARGSGVTSSGISSGASSRSVR